jgi:hypothetical protein
MNHLMIDLETLSLGNQAAILAIGMVRFDFETATICDHAYTNVIPAVGDIHPSTVDFWLNQSDEARRLLFVNPRRQPKDAINWLTPKIIYDQDIIWSKGKLDITALEHLYWSHGEKIPWFYRNVADLRTLLIMAKTLGFNPDMPRDDLVEHHALDDAIYQAKVAINAWRWIRSLQGA